MVTSISTNARRAFTLIELLVVIAIIAILAGLLIVAIPALTRSTARAKTASINGIIGPALARRAAESGGQGQSFGLHPLANWSAIPIFSLERSVFVRGNGGAAVSKTGMAYRTADPAWVAQANQVLMDDDVFMGIESSTANTCDHPLLYGVRRDHLTIVGPAYGLMEHRRVAGPVGSPGGMDDPRNYLFERIDHGDPTTGGPQANYGRLSDEQAYEIRSDQIMTYLLGTHLAELAKMGALVDARTTTDAPLICQGRLRARPDPATSTWEAGRLKATVAANSGWFQYRLRGKALYDGWGRELLCFSTSRGMTIASAGEDGVFVWHPGTDGVYQTAPQDASIASGSDDRNGTRDNVIEGHWGQP